MNGVVGDITPLDWDGFQTNAVGLAARRFFNTNGYFYLHDLWPMSFKAALAQEARVNHASARVPESGPRTLVDQQRVARRQTLAAAGALLARLHISMTSVARTLSGRLVVPTFSAYGYYKGDDEVLLHFDSERCDVTLLIAALGAVGPLHLRPELRGHSMDELGAMESDPRWDRSGGIAVTYPELGALALAGNAIPHNRPPRPIAELSAVAALCFRSLF